MQQERCARKVAFILGKFESANLQAGDRLHFAVGLIVNFYVFEAAAG